MSTFANRHEIVDSLSFQTNATMLRKFYGIARTTAMMNTSYSDQSLISEDPITEDEVRSVLGEPAK